MFVKNIVDVAVDTLNANVTHNGSSLYTGNIKSVPFYFLNQKVASINISSGNIVIVIEM